MTTAYMPPYLTQFYQTNYSGGLFYANETFYSYRAGAWEALDERADIERNLACLRAFNIDHLCSLKFDQG